VAVALRHVEAVDDIGPDQRPIDIDAFGVLVHRAGIADPPVAVEPDLRGGVAQVFREALDEDVAGDFDVVVRRNRAETRRQPGAGDIAGRAIDDQAAVGGDRAGEAHGNCPGIMKSRHRPPPRPGR
jgi:hypothetical protein